MRNAGHDGAVLTQIAAALRGSRDTSCLTSIADGLARILGVTFVFIAERLDDDAMRVLAFTGPGEGRMPPECTLAGTACADVLERGGARHGADVRRRFPGDPYLGRLGVEAFSGMALRDTAGSAIGVVAAMNAAPFDWTPEADAMLTILALAAQLELRAIRSDRKLSRVARQWTATVDAMPDFVAVIDPAFRLLRVNRALARFASSAPQELIGRPCHEVLHRLDRPWQPCPHEQAMREDASVTLEVSDPHVGVPLCVTCTPFHDDHGRLVGTVHVARDISAQRQAAEEREKLIGELRESLGRVKVLSGLLPICAVCKKIRDDRGYWEQVEVYVRDRTDAVFTHGICPACAKELYPEFSR